MLQYRLKYCNADLRVLKSPLVVLSLRPAIQTRPVGLARLASLNPSYKMGQEPGTGIWRGRNLNRIPDS